MKKYIILSLLTPFIISIFISPTIAHADDKCTFSDTLELGSVGEEVRCLQKYLNSSGYIVSSSGVGSIGYETNTFREKTKEAVKKWQIANGIYPATGNFGPLSKSIYEVLTVKKPTTSTATTSSSNTTTVISNNPNLSIATTTKPTTTTTVTNTVKTPVSTVSATEKEVIKLMKTVRDAIEKADDEIDEAKDDGDDVADMEEMSQRAKDKLIDGVYAFIDGDYVEAKSLLSKAKKYSDNSIEDIVDDENKEDAEEAIQDAKKALSDARDDINEADDDGDDTDEALDIYDDAKEKYDDAREAFDDEDYEEAIDLAKEAEELADEASDAL